eukprot:6478199-Amphidinium_carterae.4
MDGEGRGWLSAQRVGRAQGAVRGHMAQPRMDFGGPTPASWSTTEAWGGGKLALTNQAAVWPKEFSVCSAFACHPRPLNTLSRSGASSSRGTERAM